MTMFEAEKYRVPTGNVAGLLALARGLITACRKDAPPLVKKFKKRLEDAVVQLEAAWTKLDGASGGVDPRLADNAIDSAHAAVSAILEAFTWLPKHVDAQDVADAQHARERLYGDGLSFLKLPYPEEWAESQKRIKRIQDENLQATLERLCGKQIVAALFTAHKEYGAALGITAVEDPIVATKVGEPFTNITNAVNQYVRAVIGTVDEEEPETVELATVMLRPVEVYRARILAGRAAARGEDPVAPVPMPPAEPVAPVAAPPAAGGPNGSMPIPSPELSPGK